MPFNLKINLQQNGDYSIPNNVNYLCLVVCKWNIRQENENPSSKGFQKLQVIEKDDGGYKRHSDSSSVIEEIGMQDHSDQWDMGYYDRKFSLIGGS